MFGGARVSKASARVATYGEFDELNSVLGLVRAHTESNAPSAALLQSLQQGLFALCAELASVPGKDVKLGIELIGEPDIEKLESAIDALETDLPQLKTFILPGGGVEASFMHFARSTCRRAERSLVALAASEPVRAELVRYVNRLSDLLFVMARHANFRAKIADVPWLGRTSKG